VNDLVFPPLELLMTTPHLSDDDVRDLFSDHLEGALDDVTRAAVDAAIAKSPALQAEQRAFATTVEALRALPRPEPSERLVAQVRNAISAERRAPHTAEADRADAAPVNGGVVLRPQFGGWRVVSAVAAMAAVVAVIVVAVPKMGGGNGAGDVLGAGLVDEVVTVQWSAAGVDAATVAAAAKDAGMGVDGDTFVGDQRAAARFFVALKAAAVGVGSDVSGALPERAERVVVTVTR